MNRAERRRQAKGRSDAAREAALKQLREGRPARAAQLFEKIAAKDPRDSTALHFAVQEEDTHLVAALLAAGADPSRENDEGKTPLDFALDNGDIRIIEALMKHEWVRNHVHLDGVENALRATLEQWGVDTKGRTIKQLAEEGGFPGIASLF